MLALFLPLLALLSADPGDRPSSAALRRTYEGSRSSIVEVIGPKRSGIGIIVGAGGEVLTSVDYVGLNEAKVRWEGRELPARVTLADAGLKVAMLEISAPGSFSAVAVKLLESLQTGSWALGIVGAGTSKPSVLVGTVTRPNSAEAPFAEMNIALAPGSPVFDGQGRMIALAVQRSGKKATLVLPLSRIKAQLASALQP
jgi:hypothetical protein